MIILICGQKFSGKSTVAQMLSKITGYKVMSFAEKLKDILCLLSGCTREQLEDYDFKEKQLVPEHLRAYCGDTDKPTYRAFLDNFGTGIMRQYNNYIWIDCTLNTAPENVIISDCRFINEVEKVRKKGGVVIKVVRDNAPTDLSLASEREIPLIQADYTIENNGSKEDLFKKVCEVTKNILGKV